MVVTTTNEPVYGVRQSNRLRLLCQLDRGCLADPAGRSSDNGDAAIVEYWMDTI